MTKARDLANIISGGFTVADLPTLTESQIPNLSASKITSGSLADARIPSLAASKITSGTFADARIAASNVSQHATSFDDNKIVNDISTLGLRVHTQENLNASNSNSASFDVFQDSSAVSNLTNVQRNSGEYISSVNVISQYYFDPNSDYWTWTQSSNGVADGNAGGMTMVAVIRSANGSNWTYNGSQGGGFFNLATTATNSSHSMPYYAVHNIGNGTNNGNFGMHTPGQSDCNTSSSFAAPVNEWVWVVVRNTGIWSAANTELMYRAKSAGSFTTQADANGGTANRGVAASGQGRMFRHISNGYTADQDNTHVAHMGFWNTELSDAQLNALFNSGNLFDWTTAKGDYNAQSNLQEYFKIQESSGTTMVNSANGGNATRVTGSGSFVADTSLNQTTANATGSFTGNNITASSSTNKMGAVITYQDNAGTNALNTDIVLQLSADGGSNYSTATLTALPDFATGIKMAKVNDLSVTAGTSLKYKLSFANQASGSKEARIRGVSLQY